jgi:SagB-type dehydrogenase family enzyme
LGKATAPSRDITRLPAQKSKGKQQLAILLAQRHSVRSFSSTPLTLAHLGQLLWAAQGMTHEGRRRTAPSAGALYPLELFVLVGRVEGLAVGVYQYEPQQHALRRVQDGDRRQQVASAAWEQMWLASAPAMIVIAAVYARTAVKYGPRASRYVHIEAGHAAENLFLQAQDLDLATAVVGAFDDPQVVRILGFSNTIAPLLLMPVGMPHPSPMHPD